MRFVSAQLVALLEGDLWLRSAITRERHGGQAACVARGPPVHRGDRRPAVHPAHAVERGIRHAAAGSADRLREPFRFYDWEASKNEVRWMTAFDTTEADIDAFVEGIRAELAV